MNNIDIQYENITAVLSKELAVYETIIDLFRQKQECILKGNIDNLKSEYSYKKCRTLIL